MITPVGLDTESSWKGLINGKSGIGPITQFDAKDIPTQIAGEIHGFEPEKYIELKEIKKMDRFIHLAIAASQMAMDMSGLKITPENAERVGVVVSAGIGGLPAMEKYHKIYLERGFRKITPFYIPMLIINEVAGNISMHRRCLQVDTTR
jgi:3-oxoacyl-[acyl-carrier-protein] synthase II